MNTTVETINKHLAAIADLARQQQQEIERLASMVPSPTPKHLHGVVAWFSDDPLRYAEALRTVGITAVRGWVSASGGEPSARDLAGLAAWKAAGMFTIACVHPDSRRPLDIDALAARLTAHNRDADAWELGNEPDLPQYWPAGWSDFVAKYVSPLAWALKDRDARVRLVLPALGNIAKQATYEAAYAEATRDAPADWQAVHPYSTTAGDLDAKLLRMSRVYRLPLAATEWDIARGMGIDAWKRYITPAIGSVRQRTVLDCFYRLRDTEQSPSGEINLFTAAGAPSAAWVAYRTALQSSENAWATS